MPLAATLEAPPITTDRDGVVRVGGTRVTLDSVVGAFREGATAEEIVLRYPSLQLADVYATVTYYLRHRNEVDAYIAREAEAAESARAEAEEFFDTSSLRARLLARRSA